MTTGPESVDTYIAALDGDARVSAENTRRLIHRAAPGITETMRYKMPCFLIDGEYLVYFGAWKRHLGLYPIPTLTHEVETKIAPYRAATDTVKFLYKNPIPYDLIERLIAELISQHTGNSSS